MNNIKWFLINTFFNPNRKQSLFEFEKSVDTTCHLIQILLLWVIRYFRQKFIAVTKYTTFKIERHELSRCKIM